MNTLHIYGSKIHKVNLIHTLGNCIDHRRRCYWILLTLFIHSNLAILAVRRITASPSQQDKICYPSKVLTHLVMKLVRDKNGTYSITQYIRFSSKPNIFISSGVFFHVLYEVALSSSL